MAQATPVYYTFGGTVDNAYDYHIGSDVSTLGNFTVGVSTVVWTFMIDTDVDAHYWWYGTYYTLGRPPYVYSEVISGHGLPVSGADPAVRSNATFACAYCVADYASGSEFPDMNPNELYVDFGEPLAALTVGQTGIIGVSYVDDRYGVGSSGLFGYVKASNMELLRISDTAPVPEPGTLFLLGSGLTGLTVRRRKRP